MNAAGDPRSLLETMRARAVVPVSGFRVGAVATGQSGRLYGGANVEFAGLPLTAGVHAEQAAIVGAWRGGERGIRTLTVSATPCGYCRQFLYELPDARDLTIAVGAEQATLAELLPRAFGPDALGVTARFLTDAPDLAGGTPGGTDPLAVAAHQAARRSHAPYSGAYAGIALQLADGAVVAAPYIESAAYHPSLPPLAAACALLAADGMPFEMVRSALLAEASGRISQRTATAALLGAVAPTAAFRYLRLA